MFNDDFFIVRLKRGDLCKVVTNEYESVEFGEVVEFIRYSSYDDGYLFKTPDGKRIILKDDTDFQTLPLVGSLQDVIDFALDTNDEEWFENLLFMLETESVDIDE